MKYFSYDLFSNPSLEHADSQDKVKKGLMQVFPRSNKNGKENANRSARRIKHKCNNPPYVFKQFQQFQM